MIDPPGKVKEQADRRENVSFSDIGELIWRNASVIFRQHNALLILGCSLVAVGVGIIYLLLAPATYTARAQLLIDLRLPQFLQGSSTVSGFGLDSSQLESHIVLIQSERVATIVINKLGLLQDREFQKTPGLLGWLFALHADEEERMRAPMERFHECLEVRRIGISYAVEVAFSSDDAAKAAKIANATTEAYLQSLIDFRSEAARVAMQPDSYTVSNVHVISKALVPNRKSSPKTLVVLALALTMGAVIGACAALAREIFKQRADSPPTAIS